MAQVYFRSRTGRYPAFVNGGIRVFHRGHFSGYLYLFLEQVQEQNEALGPFRIYLDRRGNVRSFHNYDKRVHEHP